MSRLYAVVHAPQRWQRHVARLSRTTRQPRCRKCDQSASQSVIDVWRRTVVRTAAALEPSAPSGSFPLMERRHSSSSGVRSAGSDGRYLMGSNVGEVLRIDVAIPAKIVGVGVRYSRPAQRPFSHDRPGRRSLRRDHPLEHPHQESPADNTDMFRKARKALKPGGAFVISDFVLNDDRHAKLSPDGEWAPCAMGRASR